MKKALSLMISMVTMVVGAPEGFAQEVSTPLVTLESGPIAQLCADCPPRQIRYAVIPKSGFRLKKGPNPENPAVVEVSFGNLRDGSLPPLFSARWEISESGIPLALVIQVDPKVNKAGNYDVILNLQPKSLPAAPRLKLQIIHAAGKLELPEKLIVNRIVYWPFSVRVDKMGLSIREASGNSRLTHVQTQPQTSMLGTQPVTGQLVFVAPNPARPQESGNLQAVNDKAKGSFSPFEIGAGEPRKLDYDLVGDFPLGTVTGSVRFLAPELAEPASLSFEVRSHLTKLYILIVILLGLLMSWYLKVYLHNAIQLGEARLKAGDLLDRVQADWNRHRDQTFRDNLTQVMGDLRTAIQGEDANAIEERRKALDEAWRSALQDFGTRRQEVQKAFDDLRAVTEGVWVLPLFILKRLEKAKEDSGAVRDLLAQNDAAGANEALRKLEQQLAGELREAARAWQRHINQYLNLLAEAKAGLPATVVAQFKEVLGKSSPELKRINADQVPANPAALLQLLRDFEVEYGSANELLGELRLRLEQEWTQFKKILNVTESNLLSNGALPALKAKLDAFGEKLKGATSEPGRAADDLQGELSELQSAWREATVERLPPGSKLNVDSLLQSQQFLDAAQKITDELGKARDVILKRTTEEKASVPAWPEFAGVSPASSITVLPSSPYTMWIPETVARLHLTTLKQIRAAKRAQSLLIGVLLVVWAYGSYSQNYNGTWSELSTIFFGAFGLDITLDVLLDKIKTKSG